MSFYKFVDGLNGILMKIAGVFFVFMVGITCADIILRTLWKPILGTVELVMYANAVLVAFALGSTQLRKGHIAVDILVNSFSIRTKKFLNIINSLLCTIFFSLVTWQITKYANVLLKTGELSETLRIPYYFYVYANALGTATLTLAFITDFIKTFEKEA